jgi:peptidoglycan/xylan/chitin deacetylase (PgdA/CDA1 family)
MHKRYRRAALFAAACLVMLTAASAWAAKPPPAPKTGTITVIKSLAPSVDTGRFDFTIGSNTYTNGGAGYGDEGTTAPQTITAGTGIAVSESTHNGTTASNYASSYVCLKNGGAYLSGTGTSVKKGVNLGSGEAIVCTFTNVDKVNGSIELKKVWSGTASTTTLTIGSTVGGSDIASKTVNSNDTTGAKMLRADTYYVNESSLTDYASALACVNGSAPVTVGPDNSVAVPAGAAVVCTFTNTFQAPPPPTTGTLEIAKTVSNPDGASLPSTYAVSYDCGSGYTGQTTIAPGSPATVPDIPAGNVCTVTETTPDPIASYTWATPTYAPSSVTISADTTSTITVANAISSTPSTTGTIELKKLWSGGTDTTTLTIGSTVGGSDIASKTVNSNDTTGAQTVPAGTYYVNESTVTNYSQGLACVNGTSSVTVGPNNSVPVNNGDTVVCTFTNTYVPPTTGTVELAKVWSGGTDTTTLKIGTSAGGSDVTSKFVNSNDTTGPQAVQPGTYYVSETSIPNYTGSLACVNGSGASVTVGTFGDVTVNAGSQITCTFTNTYAPPPSSTIELKKIWSGGTSSTTLAIGTSAGATDVTSTTVSSNGTTGPQTVNAGTYYVSESAVSGYTSSLGCVDGTGTAVLVGNDGSVVVNAGDQVVCTFTNNRNNASTVRPINNDCSAGYVAFTFDDGPDIHTPQMMQTLLALNMKATFFILGNKVGANPQMIADEVANGFSVQNHTWDHASWTGASTGTAPLTDQQITDELTQASQAIVAAGAPQPTLYRPPYGDINSYDDLLARNLGYRIVMPWSTPSGNIVDSRDWTGISSAQIASNVINGYTLNGNFYPGIKADSIVAMHDGDNTAPNTMGALQQIVDYMNANHLCSASTIRQDATGGVVPVPAPPEPTSGNLVQNPSLETLPTPNTPASEPVCFQQAGANVASNVATWTLTNNAHTGSVAERVDVTSWSGGDRKLVLSQRGSQASCLAAVTPGATYSMWIWYTGSWVYSGSNPTKVSIVTYYRNSAGAWVTWQASPLFPPTPTGTWNLAYFKTAALPAGATAISFGLAIAGVGNLTTDDYAMTMN